MKKNGTALTILLYHGVTDVMPAGIENYSGKHCRLSEFIRQMAFLKNNCYLLGMDDVIGHYIEKRPFPENAVAVTFDDGFKNNFMLAIPILSEFKIPATFYLSTGFVDADRMFWVDRLEDCVNRSRVKYLDIVMNRKRAKLSLAGKISRIKAIETIKNYCKTITIDEKNAVIKHVAEVTGVTASSDASKNYLTLSWDEVRQIISHPLFTVGGHSVNHNILTKLSAEAMMAELSDSVRELNEKLNIRIKHYSYPEGQITDYDDYTIKCLKELGILCCPSAVEGTNTLDDDLFHLKRIAVGFNRKPFPFFKG